jgi:CubicO group peptidase (beta-lactamase class C family)
MSMTLVPPQTITHVATGFEPVAAAFGRGLRRQLDVGGAALSVTVHGRSVADLVGGEARPDEPWTPDTPAVLMSVTKGLAGLCAQLLSDRGLLDPDAPVVEYWPEFGANGKAATTVRQVLTHTCGVVGLPDSRSLLSWDGTGWSDLNALADSLASSAPAWEPGTAHGYHAVTYGWLVGELVRRITGRTLGAFFAAEVAQPLGIRTAIGVGPEVQAQVALVDTAGMRRHPLAVRPLVRAMVRRMRSPETLMGKAFLGDGERSIMESVDQLLAWPAFLAAEIPSSNGVSSAHDLARLFSVLAMGGSVDGVRLLSLDGVRRFAEPVLTAPDAVMDLGFPGSWLLTRRTTITRSLGYTCNDRSRRFGPSPLAYGCEGAGGQVAFCDPERGMSLAFVRSALSPSPRFAQELVRAVYECVAD